MQKLHVRLYAVFVLLVICQYLTFAQVTKLTNQPYGSYVVGASSGSTVQNLYLYGNSFYFVARSAADAVEWQKLDLTNNQLTQITTNHYRNSTGNTIFRDPIRLGDNVFVSSAAPNNLQDLEFSRFNLATTTEQRADIYPGTFTNTNGVQANSSDPIQYVRAANGRVYFKPYISTVGNQIWYWDPSNQSVTQLTSYNLPSGISQNTQTGMVIIGDTLYTSYGPDNSSASTNLLRINITNGTVSPIATAPYYITQLTVMNGKLYFSGRASNTLTGAANPYNLYVYNPATGNSTKLTNYPTVAPTTNGSTALRDIFVGNDGRTLFVNVGITTSSNVNGDFFSVNTQTDVVTYRNIAVSTTTNPDRCYYLHSVGNNVYVVRRVTNTTTSTSTYGIYKINLTTNVSTLIGSNNFTNINFNTPAATTNVLDPINGRIYLQAAEVNNGSEVYELNLTTDAFTRLTDITAGSGDSNPTAFGFYNSKLYFLATATGTASPDYEFYSVPVAMILPLKWMSFTATPTPAGTVQLAWKVEAVQNVKSFVIEYSLDGSTWNDLANVPATSASAYQYLDQNKGSKVVYYRIKELSADGSYTYSQVQKVLTPTKLKDFTLIDNPSKSKSISVLFSAETVRGELSVIDAGGRTIIRRHWSGGSGTLKLSTLGAGMYIVRFNDQSLQAIVQ